MKKYSEIEANGKKEKSQWKASSIGISGIKIPEVKDTIKKDLEAVMLENLKALEKQIISEPLLATSVLNDFFDIYSARVSYGYSSYARKIIGFYRIALEENLGKPFEKCFAAEILTEDIVNCVCNQLFKCKCSGKYKSIAKQIITHVYGAPPALLKLNPQYNKLINIISCWDKEAKLLIDKRVAINPATDHKLLGDFLEFQYIENRRTQPNDKRGVLLFLKWLTENVSCFKGIESKEIDVCKITKEHISLYEQHQEIRISEKEITRGYCGSILFQPLKRWFYYLHTKKIIFVNPCSQWKFKWERNKRDPILPTGEEIKTFLKTIYLDSNNPLMDIALFGVYIQTGLRSVSALGTKVKDFNPRCGTLKVTLKGGNDHIQELHPFNVIQIERYLKTRVFNTNDPGEEPLWLNRFNRPVSRECITRKLHKYINLAGLEVIDGPHILRHLFISESADVGCSLQEIAEMIGAKSPSEIEPYLHSRKKELFNKVKKQYPKLKNYKEYEDDEN